jgi:hypothetical protein
MLLKKPPRPRRCPECRQRYQPKKSIQPTCGKYLCEVAFATKRAAKREARHQDYVADLERRGRAGLLKPVGVARDEAQAAFNTFVRLIDAGQPCISCGTTDPKPTHMGQWAAGHYLSVGAAPELRFELRNVHRQCHGCNGGSGQSKARDATVTARYRAGLVLRYGQDYVDWLEGPHAPKRYRLEDFLAEKAKWLKEARDWRKALKAGAAKPRPERQAAGPRLTVVPQGDHTAPPSGVASTLVESAGRTVPTFTEAAIVPRHPTDSTGGEG